MARISSKPIATFSARPYLHLPVNWFDNVLKSMNRRHSVADYLDVVVRMPARPDIAFSSDFIVGYPGETDADFDQTLACSGGGLRLSYAFKYSAWPGTPAAEMSGQIDDRPRLGGSRRFRRLSKTTQVFNGTIGRRLRFCLEARFAGRARSSDARLTCNRCSPRTAVPDRRLVDVEMVAAEPHSLRGRVVSTAS
jgi:tRNA-2-methylthio-N6-dimethylallyladenosine synthase